ncbi:MAG: PEPxxWA-CTERM sorting domain-containing protein [Caulobacteraceae bacterium]
MTWKATLTAAALFSAATFASGASAGVVLSDNFNDGATSITPWTGDTVFTSPNSYPGYTGSNTNASTDYVATGDFGITCFTGSQGCVDLDGSTGTGNDPAGVLESISSFGAGTYTLTFELSGNQRGDTAQTTEVYMGSQLVDTVGPLAADAPFALESVTFTTTATGNLAFVEVGPSDNQGNLLDDVALSAAVPEPATWAMILIGFSGLGAMLRRRTRDLAV